MPTVSVCTPTFNRRALWESRWLLSGLANQTDIDFELVVADDHSTDSTIETLTEHLTQNPPPFAVTLLRVLTPQAKPCPASCIPDNCMYHAARGSIILHMDDDCAVGPELIAYTKLLPHAEPAIVWNQTLFVDEHDRQLEGAAGDDWRLTTMRAHCAPTLPLGLQHIHADWPGHWGCTWSIKADIMRRFGGCDLKFAGYHNGDSRLGYRFTRNGVRSYFATDQRGHIRHQGETWHMRMRRTNPQALAKHETKSARFPAIANGGWDFWRSKWFDTAYTVHARFEPGA